MQVTLFPYNIQFTYHTGRNVRPVFKTYSHNLKTQHSISCPLGFICKGYYEQQMIRMQRKNERVETLNKNPMQALAARLGSYHLAHTI